MSLTTKTMPSVRVWGRVPLSYKSQWQCNGLCYPTHTHTMYLEYGPLGPCHGPRPWLVSAVTPQWREPDKCPIIFTAVTSIWYESILSRIECVSNQMGNCRSSCPHLASGKYLLLSTSQYLCGQFKLIATNLLHATFHSLLKVKHRTEEPNLSMLEQNRII